MTPKTTTRREFGGSVLKSLFGAAAGLALVGSTPGCATVGLESRAEQLTQDNLKQAKEIVGGNEPYYIHEGTLYVAMPLLHGAAEEKGIDLSKTYYGGVLQEDGVRISIFDDELTKKVLSEGLVTADQTIDTPWGRIDVADKSMSEIDIEIEALAKRPVLVEQFNPNEEAGPGMFFGSASYFEVKNGVLVPGKIQLPTNLQKSLNFYNIGENAEYVAVSIPRGNDKDICHVIAIADANKARMHMPGHRLIIGQNYVVMPLGRNYWQDFRKFVREVGGAVSDIKGMTGAVNGVFTDLQAIDSNYHTLMYGNHVRNDPLDVAIEKTGKTNQLLGNMEALRQYVRPSAE